MSFSVSNIYDLIKKNKDRKKVKLQSCFFSTHDFLTYNRSSIGAQMYSQGACETRIDICKKKNNNYFMNLKPYKKFYWE